MQLHTLFSTDEPICLFCKSKCDISGMADVTASTAGEIYVDTYTCQTCKEKFEIKGYLGQLASGFSFTCNDISLHHNYKTDKFGLEKRKGAYRKDLVWVPAFVINFENKDVLFKKLNTYLSFS